MMRLVVATFSVSPFVRSFVGILILTFFGVAFGSLY